METEGTLPRAHSRPPSSSTADRVGALTKLAIASYCVGTLNSSQHVTTQGLPMLLRVLELNFSFERIPVADDLPSYMEALVDLIRVAIGGGRIPDADPMLQDVTARCVSAMLEAVGMTLPPRQLTRVSSSMAKVCAMLRGRSMLQLHTARDRLHEMGTTYAKEQLGGAFVAQQTPKRCVSALSFLGCRRPLRRENSAPRRLSTPPPHVIVGPRSSPPRAAESHTLFNAQYISRIVESAKRDATPMRTPSPTRHSPAHSSRGDDRSESPQLNAREALMTCAMTSMLSGSGVAAEEEEPAVEAAPEHLSHRMRLLLLSEKALEEHPGETMLEYLKRLDVIQRRALSLHGIRMPDRDWIVLQRLLAKAAAKVVECSEKASTLAASINPARSVSRSGRSASPKNSSVSAEPIPQNIKIDRFADFGNRAIALTALKLQEMDAAWNSYHFPQRQASFALPLDRGVRAARMSEDDRVAIANWRGKQALRRARRQQLPPNRWVTILKQTHSHSSVAELAYLDRRKRPSPGGALPVARQGRLSPVSHKLT